MSTDSNSGDGGYSMAALREMSDAEARATLTVDEYDDWQQLQDLFEQDEQTREQWEQADETVAEVAVRADMEQLGTQVDLWGNPVVVHLDPGDRHLQQRIREFEDEHGEHAGEDVDDIDDVDTEQIAESVKLLLDVLLVEWDGTRWADLPDYERDEYHPVLDVAEDKWGLAGLVDGVVRVLETAYEEQQQRMEEIESFLGAAGGGPD